MAAWRSLLMNAVSSGRAQPGRLLSTLHSGTTASKSPRLLIPALQQPQPVSRYSTTSRGHRIQREKPVDLYAILGVSPSATQQQVKEAYYQLSLKYHPDRNKGSPEAHHKFTELTSAYSVLGQYELRKKYDKGLLHQYPGRHHTTHHAPATQKNTQFMDRDKVKFNFDEFYRAHYGDALKRQRDSKRKEEEARILATYYQMPKLAQQMLIIGVTLSVLVIGLMIIPESKVQVRPLKQRLS